MGIHHSVLPEVRSDASNWFIGTMLYKNNLESYVKGEGMTRKTKSMGFHILYFVFSVKTIKTGQESMQI